MIYLFVSVFLIVSTFCFLWMFRYKVFYWISPFSIIGTYSKKTAFTVNLVSSIMIAACLHVFLNKVFHIDQKFEGYSLARILFIVAEVEIFLIIAGLLIDNYFMSTNFEFKNWRKNRMRS